MLVFSVCYLSQWLHKWMPVQQHVMSVTCHSGSTSGCLYNSMWCLLPVTVARLVNACTTACDVCYLSQWLHMWMPVQQHVMSVTCHSGSTSGCLYNSMWCLLPVTVAPLVDACTTACDVCYLSQWLDLWMPVQHHMMFVTCHIGLNCGFLYNCMWCLLPVTVAWLVDACTTACDVCYLSQWLDLWMPLQLLFSSIMVLCSSELTESLPQPSAISLIPSMLPTTDLQISCTRFSSVPPNDWHEECL